MYSFKPGNKNKSIYIIKVNLLNHYTVYIF